MKESVVIPQKVGHLKRLKDTTMDRKTRLENAKKEALRAIASIDLMLTMNPNGHMNESDKNLVAQTREQLQTARSEVRDYR